MGNSLGYTYIRYNDPENQVGPAEEPTFDPNYGFKGQRKTRKMIATKEEMIAAKLPIRLRDYCAHLALDYTTCIQEKFPLSYRCHPERHAWGNCQHEDYTMRMKEYEREKRLRERQRRIQNKEKYLQSKITA